MAIPAAMLYRAVTPEGASVSGEDATRILEIACLAVASDGKLTDEELAALRLISSELRAESAVALDALVDATRRIPSREARLERLRARADALSTEGARHCAYKVSIATALSDFASADEEFEFDLDLQDALELSTDIADRLTAEVGTP